MTAAGKAKCRSHSARREKEGRKGGRRGNEQKTKLSARACRGTFEPTRTRKRTPPLPFEVLPSRRRCLVVRLTRVLNEGRSEYEMMVRLAVGLISFLATGGLQK